MSLDDEASSFASQDIQCKEVDVDRVHDFPEESSTLLQHVQQMHIKIDSLIDGQQRLGDALVKSLAHAPATPTKFDEIPREPRSVKFRVSVTESTSVAPRHSAREVPVEKLGRPSMRMAADKLGERIKLTRRELPRPKSENQTDFSSTKSRGFTGKMRLAGQESSLSLSLRMEEAGIMRRTLRNLSKFIQRSFPLPPGSKLVFCIDVAGVILLCHDSIIIPYSLAWNQRMEGYFLYAAWASVVFWSMDLLRTFVTGFTQGDRIVRQLGPIARNYLTTWFSVDLFLLVFEWLYIVIELSSDSGTTYRGYVKTVRLLKASRMVRLGRLYRMMNAGRFSEISHLLLSKVDIIGSTTIVRLFGSMLKLVLFILWLNHVGACVWVIVVTTQTPDTKESWELSVAESYGATTISGAGLSEQFRYLFAFYWSLTTMLAGESPLVPLTIPELVLTCTYVLLGILFTSSIISYMAAVLMDSLDAHREETSKIKSLRDFLKQQNVDPLLSVMIRQQAVMRMKVKKRLEEEDVAVISLLSAELRFQLKMNICAPWLSAQPLWRKCDYVDDQIIKNLSRLAIRSITCKPGQVIFEAATEMEHSYILVWGGMQYTIDFEEDGDVDDLMVMPDRSEFSGLTRSGLKTLQSGLSLGEAHVVDVPVGSQFCEISLFAEWKTVGLVEAVSPCELLECSASGIFEVLEIASRNAQLMMHGYATALVRHFEMCTLSTLTDLTVDHDSVVALMHEQSRILMSLPAMKALQKRYNFSRGGMKDLADLEQEVHDGRCNLETDENGQVLRVVHLVVLRIHNSDGLLCAQIGKLVGHKEEPAVELPGMKMQMQEAPVDCAYRLLAAKFPKLASATSVHSWETHVAVKPSPAYGIPTRYHRVVVEASLDDSIDISTKTLAWEHGDVEGFAFKEVKKDLINKLNVYAWMAEDEYDILASTCEQANDGNWSQCPVADWLREFKNSDGGFEETCTRKVADEMSHDVADIGKLPVGLKDVDLDLFAEAGLAVESDEPIPPKLRDCVAQTTL